MSEEFSKIKKKLDEHEERISELEKLVQTKPEGIKKKLSIKEFILQKKPRNDLQRALTIGYYLKTMKAFRVLLLKTSKRVLEKLERKCLQTYQIKFSRILQKGT